MDSATSEKRKAQRDLVAFLRREIANEQSASREMQAQRDMWHTKFKNICDSYEKTLEEVNLLKTKLGERNDILNAHVRTIDALQKDLKDSHRLTEKLVDATDASSNAVCAMGRAMHGFVDREEHMERTKSKQ